MENGLESGWHWNLGLNEASSVVKGKACSRRGSVVGPWSVPQSMGLALPVEEEGGLAIGCAEGDA